MVILQDAADITATIKPSALPAYERAPPRMARSCPLLKPLIHATAMASERVRRDGRSQRNRGGGMRAVRIRTCVCTASLDKSVDARILALVVARRQCRPSILCRRPRGGSISRVGTDLVVDPNDPVRAVDRQAFISITRGRKLFQLTDDGLFLRAGEVEVQLHPRCLRHCKLVLVRGSRCGEGGAQEYGT